MAKWTLIAATAYGLYKLTRRVIGEEKWNAIMNPKPKPIEEHPNSQQQPLYNPPPIYVGPESDKNGYSDTTVEEAQNKKGNT